jgi:hypothetical protein
MITVGTRLHGYEILSPVGAGARGTQGESLAPDHSSLLL